MNQKLFTVENSFKVAGREGIVIAANLPPKLPEFKVGSAVVLIKPDGTEIIAEIGETEMIKTVGGIRKIAVLIKNITKKDVAIETEVFLKNQPRRNMLNNRLIFCYHLPEQKATLKNN